MSAPVHAVASIVVDGGLIRATWRCEAKDAAMCRSECQKTTCQTWPCSHRWFDVGYCHAVEWFDSYEPEDTCADDLFDALVNGPVEVWWDGDGWAWRYPQAAPSSGPAQPPRVNPEGCAAGPSPATRVTRPETAAS